MSRPIAAGLMCLGLITLGVTISRGDNPEAAFAEDFEIALPAGEAGEQEFDIRIERIDDIGNQIANDLVFQIAGDATYTDLQQIDISGGPEIAVGAKMVRLLTGGPIVDPAAREALEMVVANLKREAEEAQKAGRKEEFDRKTQSIGALEGLLRGGGPGPKVLGRPVGAVAALRLEGKDRIKAEAAAAADKAMTEAVAAMKAELANVGAGQPAEVREKIEQKIAEMEKKLAEKKKDILKIRQLGEPVAPVAPRAPKAPIAPTRVEVDVRADGPRGYRVVRQVETALADGPPAKRNAELDAQARKATALQKAAEALKEAGLTDQSRAMTEQAERMRNEVEAARKAFKAEMEQADKARREAEAQRRTLERKIQQEDVVRTTVLTGPGGPPELHRALVDLREQVQELRREVGQLRAVLERKP